MPFKLFEFLEQILIGAFLITLIQLEKTGSTGKVFIPLEILKINSKLEQDCSYQGEALNVPTAF